MWAYPWDLLDDGPDDVTRAMRDEIGIDAVSLATSDHIVEHLRPHTRGSRMFVATDTALYFRPDPVLWRDVRIQPRTTNIAGHENPLNTACDATHRHGPKVESWTVCLHNSYLGRSHPDAAFRNVFGDL